MTTKSEFVAAAKKYINTPFHHQGRVLNAGVDCIGLVVCAMTDCHGSCPDAELSYPRKSTGGVLQASIEKYCVKVELDELKPGDIAIFIYGDTRHVAIITGTDPVYMIHSHATFKKVVEHRLDGNWTSRLVGFYRFPWLDDK